MHVNIAVLLTAGMSRDPTLSHVITGEDKGSLSARVTAVTSLGEQVFVLRRDGDSKQLEVYDAASCTLQRRITVRGLDNYKYYDVYGLAACGHYKCLYLSVSSYYSTHTCENIHRVELTGSNADTNWSVKGGQQGLSVNKAHNVVTASMNANKLLEFTTHGSLVREICLPDWVSRPWHAVQLSTGDYVVSQDMLPGVISIGEDGQVRHRYRQAPGVIQMKNPGSLAVTENDDILVADQGNNRILSMNSSLSCLQELVLPVDGGIQGHWHLCLDETRGRLYVDERGNCRRVLVFNVDRFLNHLNQQRLY